MAQKRSCAADRGQAAQLSRLRSVRPAVLDIGAKMPGAVISRQTLAFDYVVSSNAEAITPFQGQADEWT